MGGFVVGGVGGDVADDLLDGDGSSGDFEGFGVAFLGAFAAGAALVAVDEVGAVGCEGVEGADGEAGAVADAALWGEEELWGDGL